MVELTAPTAKDTICDPASGTCDFLMAAGEYLRRVHPQILRVELLCQHFHQEFKRIKHRLYLEHVTGLSQQVVLQDFTAKVLCDNLQSLLANAAHQNADLPDESRIKHAYAHTVLKPVLPVVLLGLAALDLILDTIALIAR
jgi:23S rRNA G2445 N2-methylase RlmL